MIKRIAINAAAFPGAIRGRLDIASACNMARDAGFYGIELLFGEVGVPSLQSSSDEMAAVREISRERLPITGIGTLLNWKFPWASPDPAVRNGASDLMQKMIRAASDLECRFVTISAGDLDIPRRPIPTIPKKEALEMAVTWFQEHGRLAQSLGVELLLENVLSGFVESPDELGALVQAIASPVVAVCLDLGNAQKFLPAEVWLRQIGQHVARIHVTDYRADPNQQIVAPGDGVINWSAVRQALQAISDDVSVTTEHYFRPDQSLDSQLKRLNQQACACLSG